MAGITLPALAAAFIVFTVTVPAENVAVTPVQKVIQLLNGMVEKGKDEKNKEAIQFASYSEWFKQAVVEKNKQIRFGEDMMAKLTADINKNTADADTLARQIAELDSDIAAMEGDIKAATTVRHIEKEEYLLKLKDFGESISAVGDALTVLKAKSQSKAQESLLLQLSSLKKSGTVSEHDRSALDAFLQGAVAPPEQAGYSGHSDGIIETFKQLQDKFGNQESELKVQEQKSANAFEMLMQDTTKSLDFAKDDRDRQAALKAQALQAKADAEGQYADTLGTKEADEKYVTDISATFATKKSDFESRQTLRAEEIETVEQAIGIISGQAVSGAADKHLPALLQRGSQTVLSQLRRSQGEPTQEIADLIQHHATRLNSPVLSALALRLAGTPFAKVKKMIKDLIVRLIEEANAEAGQKTWCDQQLRINEHTRKEKMERVDELNADIDELKARISKYSARISKVTEELATLSEEMTKATQIRTEEKAANKITVKDATDAQEAVSKALDVLKSFYEKAGEATAFLQIRQTPDTFDSSYTGSGQSGGVISMLEVILSDFKRLELETTSSEEKSSTEYVAYMAESKVNKKVGEKNVEHTEQRRQDAKEQLANTEKDLENTQAELDAALETYENLKPTCINSGNDSYADKVAQRNEEIASLKSALKILKDNTVDGSDD